MSELQATLEFSVELNKFYNVDLFQRGYYHIRTALKSPPKVPSKIEITLQKSHGDNNKISAQVSNDWAVSRTFQILYRNEDVAINDVILYQFHTLINSTQFEDDLANIEIHLQLELWFCEEQNGSVEVLSKAECVSQRTLNIHFSSTKGLHHHVPLLFDYFHLCCVEVTVHGTLIAVHQPFISVPKQPKSAWSNRNPELSTLETVYFYNRPISADPEQCQPLNTHAAWQMHHRICNMLLSAYEGLQSTFEYYLSEICGCHFKLEHINCHEKLQKIMDHIQTLDNEEELIQNATRDITQLCAANVILWTQFLEKATLHHGIILHLAKEHHNARVKRFADGFFTHECHKNECLSCYEPSYHGHSDLAAMVRNSMYFQMLPPLDLECLELDGNCNTLPIIFEDIYFDQFSDTTDIWSSNSASHSPNFSHQSSPVRKQKGKRNFIKNIRPDTFKRPSSFNLQEAEAAAHTTTTKDVLLVGYRKTVASTNVHSRIIENALELGTLSPASFIGNKSTLSSLCQNSMLDRSNWKSNSDGYLPDYVKVARLSLRAKKKQKKTSVITVDFGESDVDIISVYEEKENSEMPRRLKRVFNDPVRHSEHFCDSRNSQTDSGIFLSSSCKKDDSLIESTTKNDTFRKKYLEKSDHQSGSYKGRPLKKNLDFGRVSNNLSDCLTQASMDEDLNDSDKSDDVSTVQNGYVKYVDSDTKCHQSHSSTTVDTSSDLGASTDESENGKNRSLPVRKSKVTVRDILENDMLLPLQCTLLSGHETHSFSGSDVSINNNVNQTIDVASVSHINVLKDNKTVNQRDRIGHLNHNTTINTDALTPPSSSSLLDSITDSGADVDNDTEQISVIELLKEEYTRSSVNIVDANQCIEDFKNLDISGISIKNCQKSSSDSNILQSVETCLNASDKLDIKKSNDIIMTSASFPDIMKMVKKSKDHPKLVDKVGHKTVNFITLRENLKTKMNYQGNFYSDFPTLASKMPYFHVPDATEDAIQDGCHLIVCVHGLDGNSADLRLLKTYMEMALSGYRIEFLMSERNQTDTFADFDIMTQRLVNEVIHHVEMLSLKVSKLSFIGHSLGTIIIRSALAHKEMVPLLPKLHTFLSLSGPHLGTLYNNSGLVNMGMWFMRKWKKSGSLLQLSLKDHLDPRQSFLFQLSQKKGLEYFRHVLLVGSSQDRYVPYHSSRIEMCKAAQRESTGMGSVYAEMVANILQPIVKNNKCKLIRYDVYHALPNTTNTIIGRAAHIAVLDSEIFLEKFLMVCGLKFFK